MEKIKIIASGDSEPKKANKRGKLFEELVAKILSYHGYEVETKITNVNFAGMEIDVVGKNKISGTPLYAECKCYKSELESKYIQTFFGKYMTQWFKDKTSHGIFLALPGINSHAKGFYTENCENNNEITFKVFQEDDVIKFIIDSNLSKRPQQSLSTIVEKYGNVGDSIIVYSEIGLFWIQFIIPLGSGLPTSYVIIDSNDYLITNKETIEKIVPLLPELDDFELIINDVNKSTKIIEKDIFDEIVEIKGSSSCFEYQFPASPQFLIGRKDVIEDSMNFVENVVLKKTTCRTILYEAHSGWGKSSVILSIIEKLRQLGHFSLSIDSRSANTTKFLLKSIEYIFTKFKDRDTVFNNLNYLTGYEGAYEALIKLGRDLEEKRKVLFIFFDQFENIFYHQDILSKITQLCLKISDAQTNIIFGFAWKTDLIGLTREFPYKDRDIILDSSIKIKLNKFTEVETNIFLEKLAKELRSNIRKDLKFILSESSQGYPWLLKKLCAHVINLRATGTSQMEIVRGLLNVSELFENDLKGLSTDEERTLHEIAKLAPASLSEIGDDFKHDVIQSLMHRRLIVKVANKYDIYWDIFRDYLNTGTIPIQEHYMLRSKVGSILKIISILNENNGKMNIEEIRKKVGYSSDNTFYNPARDLRVLDIVELNGKQLVLRIKQTADKIESAKILTNHLKEKLLRNRTINLLVSQIDEANELKIDDVSLILKNSFPYISANQNTWDTYANIIMDWMDIADLALLDKHNKSISKYVSTSHIKERLLNPPKQRKAGKYPLIQFNPVVQVAQRICKALEIQQSIDWSGLSRSTVNKALAVLVDMKLIERKSQSIIVMNECKIFANNQNKRLEIAINAVKKMDYFNIFLELLNEYENNPKSQQELAILFRKRIDAGWKISTSEVNIKILFNWARKLNLAPPAFAKGLRGRKKLTTID